jgi:hypothetical protein
MGGWTQHVRFKKISVCSSYAKSTTIFGLTLPSNPLTPTLSPNGGEGEEARACIAMSVEKSETFRSPRSHWGRGLG